MNQNNGLPLVEPRAQPVLEPAFRPAALANRAFASEIGAGISIGLGIEQADGSLFHHRTKIAAWTGSHHPCGTAFSPMSAPGNESVSVYAIDVIKTRRPN